MRSPIEFEKAHTYDRCRESIDSDDYPRPNSIDEAKESLTKETEPAAPPPPYSAFSINRRRFILATVTAAGFFGPLCGAVYLPSLVLFETIYKTNQEVIAGTVTVYMLVFAVAPLFGAAASDVGGRKLVYIVGLTSFLIANSLLAVLPAHIAILYFLRIFQAFGSCIVFSVGAGTVADITEPAKRASALAWFLMGPQLGPILGPVIGGQFAHIKRWRWIFGFLSVACLPVFLAILFCMPETLRSLVGNGTILKDQPWFQVPKSLRTKPCTDSKVPKAPRPSFRKFMRLLKYPPHLIVSFNGAFQFTGLYGMYIAFPSVWKKSYNFSPAMTGYTYLCPGIAMFVASIIVGRLSDWMRQKAKASSKDGKIHPERRMAIQVPGFAIAAAGKILFGWFTQSKAPAWMPLLSSALAAVGVSIVFVTSTSFQTECDPAQTASLVALGGFLRNAMAGLAAPIIPLMLNGLGYGWAFTVLGFLDIICIPGILLVLMWGSKWRENLKKDQQQG
ncbi:major facilitator superfamily domain-containing protein [Phaeosphaeriaceae sp. PMI808]|nr:major facilitator superfamily domain-containing protein [Phaeosphaeriaceae sp. PMI808]